MLSARRLNESTGKSIGIAVDRADLGKPQVECGSVERSTPLEVDHAGTEQCDRGSGSVSFEHDGFDASNRGGERDGSPEWTAERRIKLAVQIGADLSL